MQITSSCDSRIFFRGREPKAAHAILLLETERGSLTLENVERIDWIRRAHAQKHFPTRQTWGRADTKKPWFCKNFQTKACSFQKDHGTNGRLHRHIYVFCPTQGTYYRLILLLLYYYLLHMNCIYFLLVTFMYFNKLVPAVVGFLTWG